jgi:hypothetical protein
VPFLERLWQGPEWPAGRQDACPSGFPPGSVFHLSDNGTDFGWGSAAQVHLGNIGAPLEYEHFNIANPNQAQVFSLDAVISLL